MQIDPVTGDMVENTPGVAPQTTENALDPVEEAAKNFTNLLPYVSKIANASVGKGSLVRVLQAYAEFPLGKCKPRLLNQNEKLLFNILQELQGYKSTILTDFMKKSLDKQKTIAEATESAAAETEKING